MYKSQFDWKTVCKNFNDDYSEHELNLKFIQAMDKRRREGFLTDDQFTKNLQTILLDGIEPGGMQEEAFLGYISVEQAEHYEREAMNNARTIQHVFKHDENNKLHCTTGPAGVSDDGHCEWYFHGQLHRLDGPAVHMENLLDKSKDQYFIFGQQLEKHVFDQMIKCEDIVTLRSHFRKGLNRYIREKLIGLGVYEV